MDVLVVRHGVALDRVDAASQGVTDAERPLTPEGQRRMKGVARGLAKRVPEVDVLISSPLVRARQTAEILRERYRGLACIESEALLPEAEPQALERVINEHGSQRVVAVVGHEPHLSGWVGWSLTGEQRSILELRKGGACLLRFDGGVSARGGRLHWLMTPALARRLG